MTSVLFLGFVALMAGIVIALIARYLDGRKAAKVAVGLLAWFIYVGLLGYFGIIQNTMMRPPGVAFILVPLVAFFLIFLVQIGKNSGERLALAFPLWIILGTQVFRVIVELFLHQLWLNGLIPKMMTFEGANVDIFVGASAPLIAWLSMRGRTGLKLAQIWNALGLLVLANVVVRAILTTPGPLHLIHTEVPNLMIGTFPFTFIPGFFVVLAVVLHVLAIRNISSRLNVPLVSL